MSQLILSFVLLGLPHLLGATEVKTCDGVRIVTVASDGANLAAPMVFAAFAADAPVVAGEVIPLVLTAGGSGKSPRIVTLDLKGAKQRGWLGVSIGDVPEALAAQLDIDGKGVLVLDVVKGSPAEQAGVEVHDIIISLGDGENVTGVRSLSHVLRAYAPSDEVDVVVLRDGREHTIEIELGTRPDTTIMEWTVDREPLEEIEERIRTRGRIIGHGPGGKVFIKDLGDLDALKDLPEQIRLMIPDVQDHVVKVWVDGNQTRITTEVKNDGTVVTVSQENGKISVTRTDADGETEEAFYDSEEELEESDPEAFRMLSSAGANTFIHLSGGDTSNCIIDLKDFDVSAGDFSDWHKQFELHLGEATEAMEEARESAREALERALEQFRDGRSEHGFAWMQRLGGDSGNLHQLLQFGKARWSFESHADGSITVRTRKGDTEVTREFSSEADLERRDPELYEKYDDTISAADAE